MRCFVPALAATLALAGVAQAGEVTLTGENGKTGTINSQRNRTETGWTVERLYTNPQGQTKSVNKTVTPTGNGTVTTTRSTIGRQGDTTFSTGIWTTDGNGNYTGTVERTNRQGQTNPYQVNGQRSRTETGRTNHATVTGPNGNTRSYSRVGSCNGGVCTGTTTFDNGSTRTGTFDRNNNTFAITGRQGRTRTGTYQRTR
ncbi:hypothetical protein [Synechococcus sp. C9]|jgi:hypothetical protein|uniref:hypothetical protein n=1 Tax=Synechococcus sp. C9 TaxID=102119 RepID=UPI001FF192A1|nr:hypothetical protein [Synechococcus sp. C9]